MKSRNLHHDGLNKNIIKLSILVFFYSFLLFNINDSTIYKIIDKLCNSLTVKHDFSSKLGISRLSKSSSSSIEQNESQKNVPNIKYANTNENVAALSSLSTNALPPLQTADIISELKELISTYTGCYGMYYYEPKTNVNFDINGTHVFNAASTIKIPLNLYLYKQLENGTLKGDFIYKYTIEDYSDGTGKIQYSDVGSPYTINQLSDLSITCSDNIAANILFRILGKDNIKDFMEKLGGEVVDYNRNISSPKDMGLYMKCTYNFCNSNSIYGSQLLKSYLNTEFNDRIPAKLPKQLKIAHKIGTQVDFVNDVAIIYTKNPYILSIMSSNDDEETASSNIGDISKIIYEWNTKKNAS
jgi:beta-lactamase class A